MKRLVMVLMTLVFLMSAVFVLPACAETVIKDGIEVTLTTDKESYDSMDAVNARLTITNTNRNAVQSVSSEITAPGGYVLSGNAEEEHGTLRAGQSQTQEAAVYPENYVPKLPKTGDSSRLVLWVVMFIFCAAFVCAIVRNPHAKRFLSLLLCMSILSPYVLHAAPAQAQTAESTITVKKNVAVAGKSVTLTGTVKFAAEGATDWSEFDYEYGRIIKYRGNKEVVHISEDFSEIGTHAFEGATCKTLYIPKTITSIVGGFALASSIENIYVDEENEYYTSIDGVLFSKDKKELIQYPTGRESDKYIVPNGTEVIGLEAFAGSRRVTQLPEGGQQVGGLSEVQLAESVQTIGLRAFQGCWALQKVYIPKATTTIGGFGNVDKRGCFEFCSSEFYIEGFEGSAAEAYCNENFYTFVAVSEIPECDHYEAIYNKGYYYVPISNTPQYGWDADHDSRREDGHQIGYLNNRCCKKCSAVIANNIILYGNTLYSHEMANGVCSLCGYQAPQLIPASITDFALREKSVTIGNSVHVKSGMAYGGDYYLRKIQISVFTDDAGNHGYYSNISKEFAYGEATSYDLSELGAIAINEQFECNSDHAEEAFPAGDAMVMVFVSVYN